MKIIKWQRAKQRVSNFLHYTHFVRTPQLYLLKIQWGYSPLEVKELHLQYTKTLKSGLFLFKILQCSIFECNFAKLFSFSCNKQGFTKTTTVMLSLYIIAAKLLWPMRRIAIEPLLLLAMILFLQNRKSLQKKIGIWMIIYLKRNWPSCYCCQCSFVIFALSFAAMANVAKNGIKKTI